MLGFCLSSWFYCVTSSERPSGAKLISPPTPLSLLSPHPSFFHPIDIHTTEISPISTSRINDNPLISFRWLNSMFISKYFNCNTDNIFTLSCEFSTTFCCLHQTTARVLQQDWLSYSTMNCDMKMVSSPSPLRCVQQHQGGHHTSGIGGIVPHLCSCWVEFLYAQPLLSP